MIMEFDFEGFDELLNQIEKLGDKATDIEKVSLQTGAEVLKEDYQNNIYNRIGYDTGVSQESITVSKISNHQIHIGPTTDAFYLRFLENGFYNVMAKKFIPATPIFQPIFLQSREKVLKAMIEAARNEMSRL